jgi:hypothetical protein
MVNAILCAALYSVHANGCSRDQELRFTVHDSPDYFKLKCSVFNEDKKNDLIGEVWMDLKDVIVPGGGQNDIWHQLQFKGKYAGEIRVELTYYDTRPKEEPAPEKKREKEKSHISSGGNSAAKGGPRQLGPREVKRRPLPQGPLGSSPTTRPPPPDHVHSSPTPALHPGPNNNGQGDHRDIWAPDQHYHSGIEQTVSNYEASVAHGHDDQRPLADDYALSSHQDFSHAQEASPSYSDHNGCEKMEMRVEPSEQGYHSDFDTFPSSPATHPFYYTPRQDDRRHSTQQTFPSQNIVENSPPSPYGSSSPVRPSPGMVRSASGSGDNGQHAQFNRYSPSVVKTDAYRDSPLRQSISHHEIEPDHDSRPASPEEEPPPPPPAHGQRLSLSRLPSNTYPDTNNFQVARKPPVSSSTNFSPDARSPLQTIERNFDPYYQPDVSPFPPQSTWQDSYETHSSPGYEPYEPPPRSQTFPRPSSNRENNPPPPAASYDGLPTEMEEPMSYDVAENQRSWNGPSPSDQPLGLFSNGKPTQGYDFPDIPDQQHTFQSQPPIVRPRAISPGARNAPPRKPVSPHPSSALDGRRLSGVPFGPDSYDVLNPVTSPAVTTSVSPPKVETPEQLKEAARLREAEKLREQGPIIGNDGREIDPSDHLPSDTWAPEPERKTRKPEVVIRFRTKDEAVRTPIKFGSSPASARPLSMPGPPPQSSSPYSIESPSSRVRVGRNRLQKQMPSRPLPVQPFQHPHSSPPLPLASRVNEFNTPSPGSRMAPASDFNTHSSGSRVPMRPALSEYSVMANRSYGNSSHNYGYEPSPPPIPAKVPFYSAETPPRSHGNMDPFAAEMSSIDIGGSGGRRSGGRPRRVFEV